MLNLKLLVVFVAVSLVLAEAAEPKRPCFVERNKSKLNLLGAFKPVCESDGSYMKKQCHGGSCYCVNAKTGNEVENTKVERGQQLSCDKPKPSVDCKSPKETGRCRAFFRRWYYNPQSQTCESFGWGGCGGNANRYSTEQKCQDACHGRGANTPSEEPIKFLPDVKPFHHLNFPVVFHNKGRTSEKLCNKKSLKVSNGESLLGRFVPRCNQDGLFEEVQCHASFCFCVHKHTGKKIPGTSIRFGQPKHCRKTKCRNKSIMASMKQATQMKAVLRVNPNAPSASLPGIFVPECGVSGEFKEVQCHDGGCFCVNTTSGEELMGTRSNVRGEPMNCRSKCVLKRHNAYTTVQLYGWLGYNLPRCLPNGDYDKVQCLKTICYCADPKTGLGVGGKYPEDCK